MRFSARSRRDGLSPEMEKFFEGLSLKLRQQIGVVSYCRNLSRGPDSSGPSVIVYPEPALDSQASWEFHRKLMDMRPPFGEKEDIHVHTGGSF